MSSTTQTPPRPPPSTNGATATIDRALRTPQIAPQPQSTTAERTNIRYLWAAIRLGMAWTFLWPFFDKMFGLNHQTTTAQAWINGGNPTKGFLSGSAGLLSGFYTSIAGAGIVNVLFMAGLLGIGVALALGIAMKPAAIAGATMLILMWSASLPPSDDLFLDNHIIHALLLIGLAAIGAGKTLGFGERWQQIPLVQQHHWLASPQPRAC
jgi:thiosulfate dehydrogenase (quinone) large subunit